MVVKKVTVVRYAANNSLLRLCVKFAAAAAGMGLHVKTTAHVLVILEKVEKK